MKSHKPAGQFNGTSFRDNNVGGGIFGDKIWRDNNVQVADLWSEKKNTGWNSDSHAGTHSHWGCEKCFVWATRSSNADWY